MRIVVVFACCLALAPQFPASVHAVPPASRYVQDTAADTVTDTVTGFVWKRTPSPSLTTWSDAPAYCTSLGTGWRVPSVKELLTLVDPTRFNPASDPKFITPASTGMNFWSSTPAYLPGTPSIEGWLVHFANGRSERTSLTRATTYNGEPCCYVRCVR